MDYEFSKSVLIEVTSEKQLEPILNLGFEIDNSMTYQLSDTETNYVCRRKQVR